MGTEGREWMERADDMDWVRMVEGKFRMEGGIWEVVKGWRVGVEEEVEGWDVEGDDDRWGGLGELFRKIDKGRRWLEGILKEDVRGVWRNKR